VSNTADYNLNQATVRNLVMALQVNSRKVFYGVEKGVGEKKEQVKVF